MKPKDGKTLIQIQMVELRRLQACDRENARLVKRNAELEQLLARAVHHNRQALEVLEAAMEEGNERKKGREGKGKTGTEGQGVAPEKEQGEGKGNPRGKARPPAQA